MSSDAQIELFSEATEADRAAVNVYQQNILKAGCTPIFSDLHLAELLGFDRKLLYAISNGPSSFYRTFDIPKRNGTKRRISEPLPTLKEIQRKLVSLVFSNLKIHRSARGFKKGSSIRSNASLHVGQKFVLNVDVKDFFDSIKIKDVYDIVLEIGYTCQISAMIASFCCKSGKLPQGAPTSPVISNIFMYRFDEQMLTFCRKNGTRYSRYADDITISGDFNIKQTVNFVRSNLKKMGLHLNKNKVSVSRNGSRKVVTGLVVNEKINSPIAFRKEFRKNVYYIKKYGIDSHLSHNNIGTPNYIDHLIGKGTFILFCDKSNNKIAADVNYLRNLKSSYP